MTNDSERIRELETRLKRLEDILGIYQLLATYGPGVDSLSEEAVAALWQQDGAYDTDGHVYRGNKDVGDLVNSSHHQSYVKGGAAHVVSLPHVTVDGDRAVATGHSRLYLRDGDHFRVERASANRWELERTGQGWKVKRRVNRMLDGNEEPRALFRRGLTER